MKRIWLCALATLLLITPQARAQEGSVVSEIRAGVLAHDIDFLGRSKEDGIDFNAEVLFRSPWFLDFVFSPRPHLGAQVNSHGDTSQIYAGLTWTYSPLDRFWLGFGAGGMIHNGETAHKDPDQKALGSHALFRLSGEIGYDLSELLSISLYYDHESNANLADNNEGLNNAGVRFGVKF
ncbi:MAG: acyloxyacyl hydrolase [Kiloniellaceae bacterium]